ncbi:LOW QUALITY PROTEIN: uncharacterized protein [Amphiura filiformis]|uniref:LOW QUALITY PROTEIN: uncharacterized protein n=1 Tax=Amphiura filiformis TaxID=82378 RepID=UPI003B20DBF8
MISQAKGGWSVDEVHLSGASSLPRRFVRQLKDFLWYIDGHHDAFANRCCHLPEVIKKLSGFNRPQDHGHSKAKLRAETLQDYVDQMGEYIHQAWLNRSYNKNLREIVLQLREVVIKYVDLLLSRREQDLKRHSSLEPMREPSNSSDVTILPPRPASIFIPSHFQSSVNHIVRAMKELEDYETLFLNELLPEANRERYTLLDFIKRNGLIPGVKVSLYTYSGGNNIGNTYFAWKESASTSSQDTVNTERTRVIAGIVSKIKTYHTRAMRRETTDTMSRILVASPCQLRNLYKMLTKDQSVAENQVCKEMDSRMASIVESADENIIVDLRHTNGRKPKFDKFWDIVDKFLADKTSVDDRRHDEVIEDGEVVTHMALALSMQDIYRQCSIAASNEDDVEVPTYSWFRLQFWPKNPTQRSALHYTGRFKIKHQVQQRQLRKFHVDAHYCNVLYSFLKKYAVDVKCNLGEEVISMISMDDKAKVQVGEPGLPMAAVARGKQVIVGINQSFKVGDHDFTKVSLVPSVTLIHEIPETIDGSFYRGQPFCCLKFMPTQPSTPIRHIAEISKLMDTHNPPIQLFYSDGGPDHNVSFLSVQISLIAYFRQKNLDQLIAVRTAPGHSYRNPVERINAILNLALQAVGMMRQEMAKEMEDMFKACGNLKKIRAKIVSNPELGTSLLDSVQSTITLLSDVIARCRLKENNFKLYTPADTEMMKELFQSIIEIDDKVTEKDQKKDLRARKDLSKFLDHCTKRRTYSFSILKCGDQSCDICLPPRLSPDQFKLLCHLPDPVPDGTGDKYLPFEEKSSDSDEQHLPSKKQKSRGTPGYKEAPFGLSAQTAQTTLQCVECTKQRVVYSKKKLKTTQLDSFWRCMEYNFYTCGAKMEDFVTEPEDNPDCEILKLLYVRSHLCMDKIETSYYAANFSDICCICGAEGDLVKSNAHYPICLECKENGSLPVNKRKRSHMQMSN